MASSMKSWALTTPYTRQSPRLSLPDFASPLPPLLTRQHILFLSSDSDLSGHIFYTVTSAVNPTLHRQHRIFLAMTSRLYCHIGHGY